MLEGHAIKGLKGTGLNDQKVKADMTLLGGMRGIKESLTTGRGLA